MRSIVLATYNLMRLLTWPAWALWWRLRRRRARWVVLHLRGQLDELPREPQRFLTRLLTGMRPQRRNLVELRRLCEQLAADSHAHGLFLRLEQLDAGQATLASLRAELLRLRTRGKQVICYLPLEASQRELYVASAADRVIAMPHAGFTALGPLASRTYVAALLERVGITVLVTAEGRYKSAADPLVRTSMSEPEREQLEAIVTALHTSWLSAVGERSQLGVDGARALLAEGMFGAARAQELGAIDELAYDDEITTRLGLALKEHPLAHERYLLRGAPLAKPLLSLRRQSKVAIVRLVGAISERGGSPTNPGIDLHGTIATLRSLAESRDVSGVILYVDSPGGSAVVSELLHREIARLDTRKPVVTWMGNVAASGGYYIAAATRSIIAAPTTLTGSIGVISIRPVAASLFEKLGVFRESVSLTPYADLSTVARAPTAAEEALLRGETARFYERFLEVVATGRRRTRAEIALLAGGRVWSGHDAHAHGLVDVLGGYHEARATLDALEGSSTRSADKLPLFVTPKARQTPALPPLQTPLNDKLEAELLGEEARALSELYTLATSGERLFAYASTLPRLR